MYITDLIKRKYSTIIKADDSNYERSRNIFVLEGISGTGHFTMTSGAFLAGLASLLGAADNINGIIAVIPGITGIIQIISSVIFERIDQRKKLIVLITAIYRILLSTMFVIPFMFMNTPFAIGSLVIIYLFSYSAASFTGSALANWIVNLTPAQIRGRYFAKKDKISLIFTAVLTIVMGKVLDTFRASGNEKIGFYIIGIIVLIFGIFNILALTKIKEPKEKNSKKIFKIKDVFIVPIMNKGFRKIIILFILWNFALQIGGPFITVFMVTNLKLDYTYIMMLSVVTTIIRVVVANYWGNLADNKSWFLTTKFSIFILAITHILWGFVNGINSIILIPVLHILSGFAWAGINISLFNIQFLFAKKEGRTMYLGLNAAIGGMTGIISAIIGGRLLIILENLKITLLNMIFGNMQILFMLSGCLLIVCSIFVSKFIEKSSDKIEIE